MNTTAAIMAEGGRSASRERRAQLVQGKTALPPASERRRTGERSAGLTPAPTSVSSTTPVTQPAAVIMPPVQPAVTAAPMASSRANRSDSGRELSRARRQAMVLGKNAVRQFMGSVSVASPATSVVPVQNAPDNRAQPVPTQGATRMAAQAMRATRAKNGRGDAPAGRPSGRVRSASQLQYAPKVAPSETYAGGKVTGVRIGHATNLTGVERGAAVQVTGSQYIGKEGGFQPREGGIKVGASRTSAGLIVTGTQVRSKVSITGDEYAGSVRITGEADQEVGDDLLERRESGAYTSMQFQRQHNPHGHTVFGTNLGRSAKDVGSRERNQERALEFTDGGLPISGSAVGRSVNVTGDESGTCRAITGDQYLMPAARQPLCDTSKSARAGRVFTRNGRGDPVTGAKVNESETWTRQRITGVDVEHNDRVTGDEYGVCSAVTGTPYVGPGQYEASCPASAPVIAHPTPCSRVTGNTPLNVDHVTGTQRGSELSITGTPYYREQLTDDRGTDVLAQINTQFSVSSPQREAQLRADAAAAEAPSAAGRITGSFAVGNSKITGNQEFHFTPRAKGERAGRTQVSGEGRMEGPAITGSAWSENSKITGTEGYIAAERNPSERAGNRQNFAGSTAFKGKGRHDEPRKMVTGMVGWSAKSAARVTISGGAQG